MGRSRFGDLHIGALEPGAVYNAIDPNVIVDQQGTPWLFFGSFGAGIKAVQLNQFGTRADSTVHNIAERFVANTAIEAPFVVRRCGYY